MFDITNKLSSNEEVKEEVVTDTEEILSKSEDDVSSIDSDKELGPKIKIIGKMDLDKINKFK